MKNLPIESNKNAGGARPSRGVANGILSGVVNGILCGVVAASVVGLAGCVNRPIAPLQELSGAEAPGSAPAPAVGNYPATDILQFRIPPQSPTGEAVARANWSLDQITAATRNDVVNPSTTSPATPITVASPETVPATFPAVSATTPAGEAENSSHEAPPAAVKLYLEGREKFDEGSLNDAISYLDQALRIDPNAFSVLRLMGVACLRNDQLARGSLYLQKAAAIRPQDVEVNELLGRYWNQRKERGMAIHYLLAARNSPERSENSASTPITVFYLAQALEASGFYRAAAGQYESFLMYAAQPQAGYRYDSELSYLADQAWAVHLAAAEDWYLVGENKLAEGHYRTALQHDPEDIFINGRLAAVSAKLGNFQEAGARAAALVQSTHAADDSVELLRWIQQRANAAHAPLNFDGRAGGFLARAALEEKTGKSNLALRDYAAYVRGNPNDEIIVDHLVRLAADSHAAAEGFAALAVVLAAGPEQTDALSSRLEEQLGRLFPEDRDIAAFLKQPDVGDAATAAQRDFLRGLLAEHRADDNAALAYFRSAIAADPKFFLAYDRAVENLLANEQFAEAAQIIQGALANKLGGARGQMLLIESEAAQQRLANAVRLAREAMVQYPDSAEIGLRLANLYVARGQLAEAHDALAGLNHRFPKFESAYRELFNLDRSMNDQDGAVAALAGLNRAIPGSRWGKLQTGVLLVEARQFDAADDIYQRLARDNPNDPELALAMAGLKLAMQRTTEAQRVLDNALGHDSQDPLLAGALAQMYRDDGRDQDAIDEVKRFYDQHADSEAWTLLYASQLSQSQCANDAEQVLRHGLDLHPKSLDLLSDLTELLIHNHREAEAVAAVQEFIKRNGATAGRLYFLSEVQSQAHQEQEATVTLQKVLAIMPDHISANNNLSFFWADHGEHLDQALVMVQRALDNEPNNAAFADTLGWVYYKQGKFKEAAEYLQKAVDMPDGHEPEGMEHLGDALYRLGRQNDAVGLWNEAAEMFKNRADSDLQADEHQVKEGLDKRLKQAQDKEAVDVAPATNPAQATIPTPATTNP